MKEIRRKVKNVKDSCTDLLLLQVELASLQRRVQLQAHKLSIIAMFFLCTSRCAIHKNSSFVKMKLKNCFKTLIFVSKDFFFMSLS